LSRPARGLTVLAIVIATAAGSACSPKSNAGPARRTDASLFRGQAAAARTGPVVKFEIDPKSGGLAFLSWDTEGGPKAVTNLLRTGHAVRVQQEIDGVWRDGASVNLDASAPADQPGSLILTLTAPDAASSGSKASTPASRTAASPARSSIRLIFPFDPKVTSTTVLPAEWRDDGTFRLPAVINAPDWGPMLLTAAKSRPIVGRLEGSRADKIIDLTLELPAIAAPGATAGPLSLTLAPLLLPAPRGLPSASLPLWLAARRGWLNALQPCARWGEQGKPFSAPPGILGNNVISDPASVSVWFYADQAFFMPEIAPGISVMPLVRRTIDYWLAKRMRRDAAGRLTGEITGYWDYGGFLDAEASPLIAAWDYVESTGDLGWFAGRVDRLELAADFLAGRDIDGDGFVEATQSGEPNALQQPNRSDAWWDALNCGHKDGYTNALIYRAWRSLADLEMKLGRADLAARYTRLADRLKAVYARVLYDPESGLLAWWRDRSGALHDYISPTLNGLAVEYGLVDVDQGGAILDRLRIRLVESGFRRYDLGVPPMLVPVHRSDYLQPNCLGLPAREDGTDTFGYYMNAGITAGHVLHFLAAHYVIGGRELGERADSILRAMLERQRRGEFQNGVRDAAFEGIDWTTWDGKPSGYEGYLADSFRFLQAVLLREPGSRARLYRPLH
jgi:hypothetical protein